MCHYTISTNRLSLSKSCKPQYYKCFYTKRFEDFYALPQNSLNMVFIGSSHPIVHLIPKILTAILIYLVIKWVHLLQHLDTSYYELQEIYNTQTPDVVVLEIYWDVLDDTFEMK